MKRQKQKTTTSKLQLKKHTIRTLNSSELEGVVGGTSHTNWDCTKGCPTME